MCVAATNTTIPAIPFPFSIIANEQNYRPRASVHHLPYAYEPVRIHRSYTVYGISASYEQSHLIILWELLYYTLNVYVLLYTLPLSFVPVLIPTLRAPYIYTLKLQSKVIFFLFIYIRLYLYVYIYTTLSMRSP